MIVVPMKMAKYIKAASGNEPFYLNGKGYNNATNILSDGDTWESRPFKLGERQETDDPCYREQTIGGRHYMLNKHMRDLPVALYQTRFMNTTIYNELKDGWSTMNYADNVRYLGLYDDWDSAKPILSKILGVGWLGPYQNWGNISQKAGIDRKIAQRINLLSARKRLEFLSFAGTKSELPAIQPFLSSDLSVTQFLAQQHKVKDPAYTLVHLHRPDGLAVDEVIRVGIANHSASHAKELTAAEQIIRFNDLHHSGCIVNDVLNVGMSALLPVDGPSGCLKEATSLSYGLSHYHMLVQYSDKPTWIKTPALLGSIITGNDKKRTNLQLAALMISTIAQFPADVNIITSAVKTHLLTLSSAKTVLEIVQDYITAPLKPLYTAYDIKPILDAVSALILDPTKVAAVTAAVNTYRNVRSISRGVSRVSMYDHAVSAARKRLEEERTNSADRQQIRAESCVAMIEEYNRLTELGLTAHDPRKNQLNTFFSSYKDIFVDLYCVIVREYDNTKQYLSEHQFMTLAVMLSKFVSQNEPNGRDEVMYIINALMHHNTSADAKDMCVTLNLIDKTGVMADCEAHAKSFLTADQGKHLKALTKSTTTITDASEFKLNQMRTMINAQQNLGRTSLNVFPSGAHAASSVVPVIHSQTERELEHNLNSKFGGGEACQDIFQSVYSLSHESQLMKEKDKFLAAYNVAKQRQGAIPKHIFDAEVAAAWYSGSQHSNGVGEFDYMKGVMGYIHGADARASTAYLASRFPLPKKIVDPNAKVNDGYVEPTCRQYSEEDIMKMLYLIPIREGAFWKWSIDNDVPVAIGMVGFRPHCRYLMGSSFALTSNGVTGRTFYMHPNFQLSDNVAQKMIYGHFTMYNKSVILNPAKLLHAKNIFCAKYLGGNGIDVYDPLSRRDRDEYRAGHGQKDIFYMPLLVNHEFKTFHTDMTGVYHKDFSADAASQKETNFSSASLYTNYWTMRNLKSPADVMYGLEGGKNSNTLCLQEIQWNWVNTDKPVVTEQNMGHFGQDVYAGCSKIRNGHGMYFKQCDYDNSSGTMRIALAA